MYCKIPKINNIGPRPTYSYIERHQKKYSEAKNFILYGITYLLLYYMSMTIWKQGIYMKIMTPNSQTASRACAESKRASFWPVPVSLAVS